MSCDRNPETGEVVDVDPRTTEEYARGRRDYRRGHDQCPWTGGDSVRFWAHGWRAARVDDPNTRAKAKRTLTIPSRSGVANRRTREEKYGKAKAKDEFTAVVASLKKQAVA